MYNNLKYNKKQILIVLLCSIVIVVTLGSMCMVKFVKDKSLDKDTILVINNLQFSYTGPKLKGTNILSKKEFKYKNDTMTFETYDDYLSTVQNSFTTVPTINADDANMFIYNMCDKYFNCYYGEERISPVFPMALSNVETPNRADNKITWSAMFPSRYVDISKLETFCVTDVISDESIYSALSKEYSTRDRGPLQMNPTYGTSDDFLNSQMSGTEKDKLAGVDTSKYSSWVSGASSSPGDRFYIPDICLRLEDAMNYNIKNMLKNNFLPKTDMQLIAMLAIGHNSGSGVWYFSDHNKKVGNWPKTENAYMLCEKLGSVEFINHITDFAKQSDSLYIDSKVATSLYNEVFSDSISDYTHSSTNGTFPIKVLYSYIKLSLMYTS